MNLNYWKSPSPIHTDYNLLITKELDVFINEQWFPPFNGQSNSSLISELTKHFPVEANGREIQCFKTQSYFDDFYNRIHIAPSILELGNIASEQTQSVNVWNAYLVSKLY